MTQITWLVYSPHFSAAATQTFVDFDSHVRGAIKSTTHLLDYKTY